MTRATLVATLLLPRLLLVVLVTILGPTSAAALTVAELQARLDAAQPGQTLVVPRGNYRGQLIVRTRVTLMAEKGAVLTHATGEKGPTLWLQAAGTRVEGLTVVGSGEGTRRDHTAIVVTAPDCQLVGVVAHGAWAGLWAENADRLVVQDFRFRGLEGFPFWERGDGVRIEGCDGVRLIGLDVAYAADGVNLADSNQALLQNITVDDSRYGIHLMWGDGGRVEGVTTRQTVAGLMAMETRDWLVTGCTFTEGYQTGSAGIRQIRTTGITVRASVISRQATGFELLDARSGVLEGLTLRENAVGWSLGGDNRGTVVRGNTHQGNLVDLSGNTLREADIERREAHDHLGNPVAAPVQPLPLEAAPNLIFEGNYWDTWRGFDLDGNGTGDTPQRFDATEAARTAGQPWSGIFLGSLWTSFSRTLPGGQVLDAMPLVQPPNRY